MDKNCLSYGIEISDSDWEGTPASVRQLVEKMGQHIKQSDQELAELKAKQQELLEKINRTSRNSSSPPSSDLPSAEKRPEKKKTGKKRGGQTGHQGHTRFLYELSDCEDVFNHRPETCSGCKEKLSGEDTNPYRHQIVEIPPIKPIIVEHRLHQLKCKHCGSLTRAKLPVDVHKSGYGVRVVALVTVLSGSGLVLGQKSAAIQRFDVVPVAAGYCVRFALPLRSQYPLLPFDMTHLHSLQDSISRSKGLNCVCFLTFRI